MTQLEVTWQRSATARGVETQDRFCWRNFCFLPTHVFSSYRRARRFKFACHNLSWVRTGIGGLEQARQDGDKIRIIEKKREELLSINFFPRWLNSFDKKRVKLAYGVVHKVLQFFWVTELAHRFLALLTAPITIFFQNITRIKSTLIT